MSNRIVGVLAYPLGEDFGLHSLRPRTLRRAYRRILYAKANPRPPDYMRELFRQRYPDGVLLDAVPPTATTLILLYPDAIGLGYRPLERRLPRDAEVRVLNGRRREFAFDRRTRSSLLVRRMLERSLAGEAMALMIAAAATPLLLAYDLARGRR